MDFLTQIGQGTAEIFASITQAFANAGDLLFVVGDTGTLTGLTPFAWLVVAGIAVGLGTWLLSTLFGWVKSIGKKSR